MRSSVAAPTGSAGESASGTGTGTGTGTGAGSGGGWGGKSCSGSASAGRDIALVPAQLAIQRGGIDAEHFGGSGLVAALALQHPGDIGALDHVERRVDVRAVHDERLGAAFRELVRQRREVDRPALAQHHSSLERVLELSHVAGPVVAEQGRLRLLDERLRRLAALLG